MSEGDQPAGLTRIAALARSSVVEGRLLAAIEGGQFPEGSRLPPERELAETFGVSRVTVRAALQALSARGIIETSQGRGSFVKSNLATSLRQGFSGWLSLHRKELVELLEIRGALEELMARTAAARSRSLGPDEPSFGELDRALRHFIAAAEAVHPNVDELAAADLNFHAAIARASGSALQLALFEELQQILHEARRAMYALRRPQSVVIKQHQAIVEAIKAGDPSQASRAMHSHVESSIGFVRTWQAADNHSDHLP